MAMSKKEISYEKTLPIRAPSPNEEEAQLGSWKYYREEHPTKMLRKHGPKHFTTKTTPATREVKIGLESTVPMYNQYSTPIGTSMSHIALAVSQTNQQDENGIANFDFEIVGRFTRKSTQEADKEFVRIRLWRLDDRKPIEMGVIINEYKDIKNKIRSKYPQCYIFDEEKFNRYASDKYHVAFDQLEVTYCYDYGGWVMENNRLVFLHNGMANVNADTELRIKHDLIDKFIPRYMTTSMLSDKLLLMLLYSLWGSLAIFYRKKGLYGLRCILYLSAPTNTGKTSIAQILAKALLNPSCKSAFRFDDTKASLEENILNRKDVVVLIDDFYPQPNKIAEADFKEKASEITRIIGDGYVKEKMGPNRKPLPKREYQGCIITTGEYADLNTYSSWLRCWLMKFPKDSISFTDEMNELVESPDIAKSFFSAWVEYLEHEQANILFNIANWHKTFMDCAKENYPNAPARFLSNVAAFMVTAKIFSDFCNKRKIDIKKYDLMAVIKHEADEQWNLLRVMSPIEVIKEALNYAIDNGVLIVTDSEEVFKQNKDCDGFFRDGWLHIITGKLDNIIMDYARKKQYGIRFDDDVKATLYDKQLIQKGDSGYNFKYTQKRTVSPQRPRIYKLSERMINDA